MGFDEIFKGLGIRHKQKSWIFCIEFLLVLWIWIINHYSGFP